MFGPYRLVRSIAADAVTTTYAATTEGGEASRGGANRFLVRIAGRFDHNDDHAVELVRQFLAESQRAGAINHPSVIRPHDLGIADGRPYVATPFVRAVPLGDMLVHGGAINEAAALALFAQLAGALDTGHRADVVHGALSPRTIWVGPSTGRGAAYIGYLTGFGTGLLLQAQLADEPRGEPLDDILYVAPEQLQGEPATRATDQYSLACALYHTLIGEPPFTRDTRAKLYGAHLMTPPPSIGPREVSAQSTASALQRGMSKDPSDRFGTCGLLVNAALPEAMIPEVRRGPFTPRDAVSGRPVAAAANSKVRRRTIMLAGAGLAFVAVVLWLLLRPSGTAPVAGDPVARRVVASTQPTGEETPPGVPSRWSTAVADSPITLLEVTDGVVVAAGGDGTVVGVGPDAGRIDWTASADGVEELAVGGSVVMSTDDGLAALGVDDGTERWRVDDVGLSSLQVTDRAVLGADAISPEGGVRAVSVDDGGELWRAPAPSDAAATGTPITARTGDGVLVYGLQGVSLIAIDQSQAGAGGSGSQVVAKPVWAVDVEDSWPVLAPTAAGVVVARKDGQVCLHGSQTGAVTWCEAVPGGDAAQPWLAWTGDGLVAATPQAVLVLDGERGVPSWSVSPGGAGNLVAASDTIVVTADDAGGAGVLDTATGERLLALSSLGEVTALAAQRRWVLIGTADGQVHRFDVDVAG